MYTHALKLGLRFLLSSILVQILQYYGIGLNYITPNVLRSVNSFNILCFLMCILPTAKLFNFYYTKSTRPNNSWIYFATRLGKKHFVDDLSNIPMMNYGKRFTYFRKKGGRCWRVGCPILPKLCICQDLV